MCSHWAKACKMAPCMAAWDKRYVAKSSVYKFNSMLLLWLGLWRLFLSWISLAIACCDFKLSCILSSYLITMQLSSSWAPWSDCTGILGLGSLGNSDSDIEEVKSVTLVPAKVSNMPSCMVPCNQKQLQAKLVCKLQCTAVHSPHGSDLPTWDVEGVLEMIFGLKRCLINLYPQVLEACTASGTGASDCFWWWTL